MKHQIQAEEERNIGALMCASHKRQPSLVSCTEHVLFKRRLFIVLIWTFNVLWFQPRTYTGFEGQSPLELAVRNRL